MSTRRSTRRTSRSAAAVKVEADSENQTLAQLDKNAKSGESVDSAKNDEDEKSFVQRGKTTVKQEVLSKRSNARKTKKENDDMDEDEDSQPATETFSFNGNTYNTYQEMVEAKRQRNRDMLISTGLLQAKSEMESAILEEKRAAATARGLKRSKAPSSKEELPRRKSSRLAGVAAPGIYVDWETSGRVTLAGGDIDNLGNFVEEEPEVKFFKNRVNDGSDLTVEEAVQLTGSKWVKDGTVESAESFMKDTLPDIIEKYHSESSTISSGEMRAGRSSPTSVAKVPGSTPPRGKKSQSLKNRLASLSLDDIESCVAKVTPERIYSVACHPSPHHIITSAGDKTGHVGIWNVDQYSVSAPSDVNTHASKASSNDGVHLFKPHNGAVSQLIWNASGTTLLSSSYDGSVRAFDANKQVFEEVFATYDDDVAYKHKIGFGLDHGYKSWVQSMELDHRFGSDGKCFFLSTSEGSVMHVDLRSKGKVTFDQILSQKKINTVSLHPNGHTMATAGLSCVVQLWDLRKMSDSSKKAPKPLAWQNSGKSVNSAYFSPSGSRIVTTTMSNTLEILEDAHLSSGLIKIPKKKIKHDNMTGRWLSTFMARWHPCSLSGEEIFVVGSMDRPRTIEVFDGSSGELLRGIRGDALTAVASRCCFHPSAEKLIVVGGNSSGRVTVAR